MTERARGILGLVTEAYGGTGGIAQYNRDFFEAVGRLPGEVDLRLLPRKGRPHVGTTTPTFLQYGARASGIVYALAALAIAVRMRPRIVICGHLFMISLAALLARLVGAKLVVQLHGIEIWRPLTAVRRRALAAADLILCVSRDTRARVLAATDVPPERILVLSNTVAEDFVPGPRTPGEPRILLSVGRLDAREAYKGHDAVIACLADLRRRGHDPVYEIAGEGNDRARLAQLARDLGVDDRVRFLGYVERDALPALYRRADLFVLASRGEGFGIVFLEAMACGTPAIGLAAGGAVDALDGLGQAVPADGLPDRLLDAIDAALTNAAGRDAARDRELAQRVRARFGRAVFQSGVAQAMARVGCGEPMGAGADRSTASECVGSPA